MLCAGDITNYIRALTKLVLTNVDGDAAVFSAMGEAIKSNTAFSLRVIDFSMNKIGIGMDSLNAAFSVYKNPITCLKLSK